MEEELLYTSTVTVEAEQRGKSEEEAFQNIFQWLRRRIHSEIDGYLVEMHVKSCVLLSRKMEKTVKKFLFFFMPVESVEYVIRVRIEAETVLLKKGETADD